MAHTIFGDNNEAKESEIMSDRDKKTTDKTNNDTSETIKKAVESQFKPTKEAKQFMKDHFVFMSV